MQRLCDNCQLDKSERLKSQRVIDKLFAGGNPSMAAFPLRMVYMKVEEENPESLENSEHSENSELLSPSAPPVMLLVSVPKKRFRHAVDRNRMKRLIREAYRLNKHILWHALEGKNFRLVLAFVCITDKLPDFRMVNKSVAKSFVRIAERL